MALLLLIFLWVAAVAIAHYLVVFIERPKASLWKAAAMVALFTLGNNLAVRFGLDIPAIAEWVLYIGIVTILVWGLFRLKPFNNLTVAASYVVGRYLLVSGVSLLPASLFDT